MTNEPDEDTEPPPWTPADEMRSQMQRANDLAEQIALAAPDTSFLLAVEAARVDRRITRYERTLIVTRRSSWLESNKTPREMKPELFK